jgi:acyl-coenzyme A synthetase/AMP-(fatty) acid ligase
MSYQELYNFSIRDKETFWAQQASHLSWFKTPSTILSGDRPGFYQWFEDGVLNTSYLCLDVHVDEGNGNRTALIYDSPVTGTVTKYSYLELRDAVAAFAGGLKNLGVLKGDTVVIYMPMIPQALLAMLACARIGAIHSVVFGGFAPHELALRIDDAEPKAIITASFGMEFDRRIEYKPLVDLAMKEAHFRVQSLILFQRSGEEKIKLKHGEYDFEAIAAIAEPADCVAVRSTDPLYVLYTSGTTGKPKGIVRDNGGHATALKFTMKNIYNVDPGDVFWAASDVGWVVGHSYIVYGPLLQGCTTVLYEGKPVRTPDAGAFWRVISEHRVKTMFTAPTAIRAVRKEDPEGALMKNYDLSCLKQFFLAGERCDPSTFDWAKEHLRVPVIDHWWQTESGWPMLGIMLGIDNREGKAGSAGFPVCGYQVDILSEEGEVLPAGKEGYVAVKLPLPPGCLPTLWKNDERFIKGYLEHFPGYYQTGDGGYRDEAGYYYIMGRIDDVINVAGHRLSTGEMEELVASHSAIAECAVVGIADELRGQRPVAFVVLKNGYEIDEHILEEELLLLIREKIGAVAFFRNAIIVKRLPKTRSGKILRKTICYIADGRVFEIPSTIDDPAILVEIDEKLKERSIGIGYSKTS